MCTANIVSVLASMQADLILQFTLYIFLANHRLYSDSLKIISSKLSVKYFGTFGISACEILASQYK